MSEGGAVSTLVGGEDHAQHSAEHALAQADPVAVVVAMDAARYDPELSRKAGQYLDEQRALVSHQVAHFDVEHRLAIDAVKRKRLSDRLRISVQIFVAVVATGIGISACVMLWDAFHSHSVVIEPFDTPPALAAQGVNGKMVASSVLDALRHMHDATHSNADEKLTTTSTWSSEVKIEVPETGMSIGEINHLLHKRFGHDIRIDGDLIMKTDGLELTVRGDGIPARHFEGHAGDLDKLTVRAAEYIYGQSQPKEFAKYLNTANRKEETLSFIQGALGRVNAADEADLLGTWGITLINVGKPKEALQKLRLALELQPHNWRVWGNLVGLLALTDGDEASVREGQAMLKALTASGEKVNDRYMANLWLNVRDFDAMQKMNLADAASSGGMGTFFTTAASVIGEQYGGLHDHLAAARWLAKGDPDDAGTKAAAALLPAYVALDAGDARAALEPLERFWKLWQADPTLQYQFSEQPCLLGLVYGLNGEMAKAEEVFKRTGPELSYCIALRGAALEHAGQLAAAQAAWAEGVRIAPSLSTVYLYRGLSALKRGDLKSAEADVAAAAERSPHWAEPFKAWGEVLARQGRWNEAVRKYDTGLRYAPAWKELLGARQAAAAKGT